MTQECDECGCPSAEHFGGRFWYFPEHKKRRDAQADCVARGGQLASIKTPADQAAVQTFLNTYLSPPGHKWVWFGLAKRGSPHKWRWEDGTEQTWGNWGSGYPKSNNGGGFTCAHLEMPEDTPPWPWDWENDKNSNQPNSYICESFGLEMWTVDFTFTVGADNTVLPRPLELETPLGGWCCSLLVRASLQACC